MPLTKEQIRETIILASIKKLQQQLDSLKELAKGDKGDDGYTPIKGRDYFDGKDGKDGKDGRDGRDGRDGLDGKDADPVRTAELASKMAQDELLPLIPTVESILEKLPKIEEFEEKIEEKLNEELTGEEIIKKINELELTPDKKIDAKHIKNLPMTMWAGGGSSTTSTITTGARKTASELVVGIQEGNDVVLDLDTLEHQYSKIISVFKNGKELFTTDNDYEKLSDIIRIFNSTTDDRFRVMYEYSASGYSREEATGTQTGTSVTINLISELKYPVDSIIRVTRIGKGIVATSDWIKTGNYLVVQDADASDIFSIYYKYTANGFDLSEEEVSASAKTTSGSDITVDLTKLGQSYKDILLVSKNGKVLDEDSTTETRDWLQTGNSILIRDTIISDQITILYSY